MRILTGLSVAAVLLVSLVAPVHAVVLTNGTVTLGVNPEGDLNVRTNPDLDPNLSSSWTGLQLNSTGLDGLRTLGPREGWGAGLVSTGFSGYVNHEFVPGVPAGLWVNQATNLTLTSFTSTASTAHSETVIGNNVVGNILSVAHDFRPSASPNLYEIDVTIANLSGAPIAAGDLRYRRVMDWDAEPTPTQDLVTIGGLPRPGVVFTSDDGFETSDPLRFTSFDPQTGLTGSPVDQMAATQFGIWGIDPPTGCGFSTNFTRCGQFTTPFGFDSTTDHGALFDLAPGGLAVGGSLTFSLFYGATTSTSTALTALSTVGAQVYSLGQCTPLFDDGGSADCTRDGGPTTFAFGVRLPETNAVPEPATLALIGSALVMAGIVTRGRWS